MDQSKLTVIENIRRSLGRRPEDAPVVRPPVMPARLAGTQEDEINLLLQEVTKLSGTALSIKVQDIGLHLRTLVSDLGIRRAAVWHTEHLAELRVVEMLGTMGVEVVPPSADKQALSDCDLGITEADLALPETGTIGLYSSPDKPRAVSLLPRIHLALVDPTALRVDLYQAFDEARHENYLTLITGPSRTADIELTVTLGVHGPKALYVWVMT